MRTFGVEEELLLVDAATGHPVALADQVTRRPTVAAGPPAGAAVNGAGHGHPVGRPAGDDETPGRELRGGRVETGPAPCPRLKGLAAQRAGRRAIAAGAARQTGAEVAALATSPLPVQPSVTLDERYVKMAERYAMTAQEQ